jgi:hypothetical protein
MDSYTYMSDEAIQAVLEEQAKVAIRNGEFGHYDLSLNRQDFEALVMCLKHMYNSPPMDGSPVYSNWAGEFLSSIAETLGIEFV